MPGNETTQEPSGSGFCELLWLLLNVRDLAIRNPPYGELYFLLSLRSVTISWET